MELTSLRTLHRERDTLDHSSITVGGWVRSIRASKNFGFIMLSDGTFFEPVQIVYDDSLDNFAEISKYNVGSALIVTGKIIETPDAKQPFEIWVTPERLAWIFAPPSCSTVTSSPVTALTTFGPVMNI